MALVTTLLLLSLMVAMTLAMVIAVSSDSLITRYYRNFRSSFYAADSGLNIVRQYMVDQLVAAVPTGTFAANVQPIPGGTESTVQTSVTSQYGSSGAAANRTINLGQGASSWPGTFKISNVTLSAPTCTPSGGSGGGTCAAPTGNPTDYSYVYPYTLTALGQSLANEQTTINDSGTLTINVHVGAATGTVTSFAAWGTFIDQYAECSAPFAPGTLTGPFFTNGAWTFSPSSPGYNFTGKVGSVSTTFGYYFGSGNCVPSANPSYKQRGQTIAPNFQAGYTLGANAIALPQNDFSQQEAVIDGKGDGSVSPTQANMGAVMKNVGGTAWPSTGSTPASGVYLPYTVSGGVKTMTGGGIYVQGNAAVTLSATTSSGGHNQQVIQIVQGSGSSATTTTVTYDLTGGSTTVQQQVGSGSPSTITINGLPENLSSGSPSEAAMVYVNGDLTSLSGPGQGQAAVQDGSALTITAAGNVTVTGDVLYKTPPVTTTQNQTVNGVTYPNTDTLIPGNDKGQVLGIFTATGDVQMNNQQSNRNIELDGSIAMISQGGSGGWINTGSSINNVTLVGGRIANQAKACNCTTRNLYFDQRFGSGGFAPPWFPSTTITPSATDSVTSIVPTTQRTGWVVANY
jgi:Tfp pilus assembly protein PilX